MPVLVFQTEGDVVPPLAYWLARQPDSRWLRSWEVAGTAHADAYLIGPAAAMLGCDWRINEGPQRFVAQAALHALNRWVREGTPPPGAPVIELAGQDPAVIARDAAGIALGGVRTPAGGRPGLHAQRGGPARVRRPGVAGRIDDAAGRRGAAPAVRQQGRLPRTRTPGRRTRPSAGASCSPPTAPT